MLASMLKSSLIAVVLSLATTSFAHEAIYDGILTLPAGPSSFAFNFAEIKTEPLQYNITKSQQCKLDPLTKVYLHRPHSNAWVLATYSRGQIFSTLESFDGIRMDFAATRAGKQTCRISIDFTN